VFITTSEKMSLLVHVIENLSKDSLEDTEVVVIVMDIIKKRGLGGWG
jgi:hypothetical protein